jgi:hypothetical protein
MNELVAVVVLFNNPVSTKEVDSDGFKFDELVCS